MLAGQRGIAEFYVTPEDMPCEVLVGARALHLLKVVIDFGNLRILGLTLLMRERDFDFNNVECLKGFARTSKKVILPPTAKRLFPVWIPRGPAGRIVIVNNVEHVSARYNIWVSRLLNTLTRVKGS